MFDSAKPDNNSPDKRNKTSDAFSSQGAQLPNEQLDNNSWQTVNFPGTIAIDHPSESTPYLRTNAMDSSSTQHQGNSTVSVKESSEHDNQREVELLNLVRDLNECNDVLLAKISQLEESLERSQTALQAEIDRSGGSSGDREIVQLITELEQSNQALQHQHVLNETLQTELTAVRERAKHLETEHITLRQQVAEHSQELLQANTSCRDLRARLQRQQRYTLQFKAALEKCLSMSAEASSQADGVSLSPQGISMPKTDEIRPWESTLGNTKLDPQLESMIRGLPNHYQPSTPPLEAEAEDQLWHDLARVMDPEDTTVELEVPQTIESADSSPEFTEPSPWVQNATTASEPSPEADELEKDNLEKSLYASSSLSPEAAEILARVQSAKVITADNTYLPAVSAQGSPSPLVNPLKPQKRIGSLSAIDLPSFPRLKKQPPTAKA